MMKFEDYLISFSDVRHIFSKHKKTICLAAVFMALLASYYTLARPTLFLAKAAFREMGQKEGSYNSSVTQILLGNKKDGMSYQAISAMKSRTLLTEVVHSLGLQGNIKAAGQSPSLLRKIADNLKVQGAYLLNKETVSTFCHECSIGLADIEYTGRKTLRFTLEFTSPTAYLVKNSFGTIGEGSINRPFRTEHFSFALSGKENYEGRLFSLTLLPLGKAVDNLEKSILIEEDEDDSTLLILEYHHPIKEQGCLVLNTLMLAYQNHLKAISDRFAESQIAYLESKKAEMFAGQTLMMEKHAQILAKDLSSSGFVNFEKEMEFLFKNRLSCLEQINKLDLLLKRLEALSDETDWDGQILTCEELSSITPSLKELTDLKMQRDSLSQILYPEGFTIFPLEEEIRQKLADERMENHTQNISEFHGIDLPSAHQLYLTYLQESHRLESSQKELEFTLCQLLKPDFEINSLSGVLKDPISQNIIQKSALNALELRDEKYHSPKEQQRNKNEMDVQKNFLKAHMEQTVKIQNLQQILLKDKLRTLQTVLLELIQEKITLLKKHINDTIKAQIRSLNQQKELILASMNRVNQNMAALPDKWISEQLMKQNVDLNKAIFEELTRLVENKNISHNLDLIQSQPLDMAYAPSLPKNPHVVLFALFGGFLGTLFSLSFFVVKHIFEGIEATPQNLKALNNHVAGSLTSTLSNTPISDSDLDTLRRQISFMETLSPFGKTCLIILGRGPDYSKHLAKILSKKGLKVLIIEASFTKPFHQSSGLLQYLRGSSLKPEITSEDGIHIIHAGGISRYSSELIGSERFEEFHEELKGNYDWILLVSEALPASPEALSLKNLADITALTISEETLPQLAPYLNSKLPVVYVTIKA